MVGMIDLDVGGGQTVQVQEPQRVAFEDNLRGALLYGIAHLIYDVLGWAGSALGEFTASVFVRWMERLEPGLVSYVAPIIDKLLETPELPDEWREFLTKLRSPTDQAGAAVLSAFAGQATTAIGGNLLSVLLRMPTYLINSLNQNVAPSTADALAMWRRQLLEDGELRTVFSWNGISEDMQRNIQAITQPRPGVEHLIRAVQRREISPEQFLEGMTHWGFAPRDAELLYRLADALLQPTDVVVAWQRGAIKEQEARLWLAKQGFSAEAQDTLLAIAQRLLPPQDILTAYVRGHLGESEVKDRLTQLGISPADQLVLLANVQQPLDPREVVLAWQRGALTETEARERLGKVGLSSTSQTILFSTAQRLLTFQDLANAWFRGVVTEAQVRATLLQWGFDASDIDTLIEIAPNLPLPQDLIRMAVREAYRDDVAQEWAYDEDYPEQFGEDMARQGFDPLWSKRYWRAHWTLPSPTAGYEMLHRGVISPAQLTTLLKVSDYPAFWRDKLQAISYTPLTRVDVRRMHAMGVLDDAGVKRAYLDIGYNEDNAELMLQFTKEYNDSSGETKTAQYKTKLQNIILRGFERGYYDRATAQAQLQGVGLSNETIAMLLDMTALEDDVANHPDQREERRADIRRMVENGYAQGYISREDGMSLLQEVGFSSIQADGIIAVADYFRAIDFNKEVLDTVHDLYVARAIERGQAVGMLNEAGITGEVQTQHLYGWDLERSKRTRLLTLAQYTRARDMDQIAQTEFEESMRALGYTDRAIAIYNRMYEFTE